MKKQIYTLITFVLSFIVFSYIFKTVNNIPWDFKNDVVYNSTIYISVVSYTIATAIIKIVGKKKQ